MPAFRTDTIRRLTRFMLTVPSTARRVGVAVAAVLLAVGVRHLFSHALPDSIPYLTLFPAVLLTAVIAGSWPAIWVALACTAYAWLVFMDVVQSVSQKAVASAFFLAVSLTVIMLVYALRQALVSAKATEEAASKLAATRDLLFHELQHRVSNNLQMIASTLAVQKRAIDEPAARAVLDAAQARIQTIASIQRYLGGQSAPTTNVAHLLSASLPTAADVSLGFSDECVQLVITGDGPTIGRDQSTLIALVAIELVSNSIEHGRARDTGKATITVKSGKANERTGFVEVRDRGDGLPGDFDHKNLRSTGLQLAELFVAQLGGTLRFETDGGTVARFEFSLPPTKEPNMKVASDGPATNTALLQAVD